MIEKTIKYTNFNGEEREKKACFHLTKVELTDMSLSQEGGINNYIERIVKEQDQKKIIDLFKELVLKSYGVVSEDGERFIKNEKLREEFSQTEAYSELFMELASDADKAVEFVNGVVPKDISKAVDKAEIEAKQKELEAMSKVRDE